MIMSIFPLLVKESTVLFYFIVNQFLALATFELAHWFLVFTWAFKTQLQYVCVSTNKNVDIYTNYHGLLLSCI